ncbi:SSI family serine proteinase inhibitor [Actinomadura chokoriensis]|uniref:SSI family serine proteinase inhibitor n=1 Tax=Actinomadura chokoriensis TaxID=454156 RepID=A0ABV4QUP1_9ACTN
MHMSRARFRWAAALAGMAVLAPAAPAQAAGPTGFYMFTVTPESGPVTAKSLFCDPDGGMPEAARACDQLESVDGEVGNIPPKTAPCTQEHAPVQVSAHGNWRGNPREFERTFPNRCVAARDTGGILFSE